MGRGVIFTIDAILAVMVAAAFVSMLADMKTTYDETVFLRLQQMSSASLDVLDKDGTLENTFLQTDAEASASLETFLGQAVPQNMMMRLRVDLYEHRPSGGCSYCDLDGAMPVNGFCRCRSFNTSLAQAASARSSAKRIFYKYDNSADSFGVAYAETWVS